MSTNTRVLLIAVPAAIVALVIAVFAIDQARSNEEVARNVSAVGIELGGLGEEEATAALRAYETELAGTPVRFVVNGVTFDLEPAEVGLEIDEQAVVAEAMTVRREQGGIAAFFNWFSSFREQVEVEVPVTYDAESLDEVFSDWETTVIASPAYEGGVLVRDGRVLPDYPRAGEGIERHMAHSLAYQEMRVPVRNEVILPTRLLFPALGDADIDAKVAEANRLLDGPVVLTADDPAVEVTFTTDDLVSALRSEVVHNSPPTIELSFDAATLAAVAAEQREAIEQPARSAEFVLQADETVIILGSRPETLLDEDLIAETVYATALSGQDVADFPFGIGEQPRFSTEDAKAMGPITRMSAWTTEYPSGQPRVTNIHTIADAVDGAVIWPGEEWSLNIHVGRRTVAKGYVEAPMIADGEFVDSVGGGVSQFATTFYNAVFYGCYEDVYHKPHSYYFDRYPEVNEATVSWPDPGLIFRNNSDAVIIVKTQYTSTSVTVKFFGNNGGKECERRLSERTDFTDPETVYLEDASLNPGSERVAQNGWQGFTRSVDRVMTMPDGTVEVETWTWRYRAAPRIILVHPCDMPDSNQACPAPVPNVIGLTFSEATSRLADSGFLIAQGNSVETSDASRDGTVAAQSASGSYLSPGSTITVDLYVYVEPPPPEEPPPDEPPPDEEPPPDDGG